MWTFLGIASFTYLYKKSDTVLSLAHTQLLAAAALLLAAGLLLSYVRFFCDQKLGVSRLLHLPLSLLSSVPVVSRLVPHTAPRSSQGPGATCRQVGRDNNR